MNNSRNLSACTHGHLPLVGRVEGEVPDGGHGGAPHPRVAVVIVEQLLEFDEAPGLPQVVLEESNLRMVRRAKISENKMPDVSVLT